MSPNEQLNADVAQAIRANPLFGRPAPYTRTDVVRSPVRGPQPRLAQGTGRTGAAAFPGTQAGLPAYVSDYEYFPTVFTYDPVENPNRQKRIAATLATPGTDDGLHALNPTYRAHDFSMGGRFNHQMRSAYNWQVQEFPVNFRNLLGFQYVRKYLLDSITLQARPLSQSNYFLGYQVQPRDAQKLGLMGGGMGTLGSA